ncbi:hypothetical protein BEWA_011170 [Theileria equi strain WA]|uniref:Uncharacterized protein n=1 Tax=Theileria equi strain WA TaxID=1537102 RepID=L0B3K7_THEEQ|nr:hypothetical protein BEWA_011170 [Theileria equi strain WA]AFZ81699.1 hypothetical protein BEWA_011170 [Theileria equi strain WA]|eukprot:XP_004831365.1 hypothetical protein BEWA_011170 [Theileria equi strain WA]
MVSKQQDSIFKDKDDFINDIYNKFVTKFGVSINFRFNTSLSRERASWKKTEKETLFCVTERIESVKAEIRDTQIMKSEILSNLEFYINTEIPQIKANIENLNKKLDNTEQIVGSKVSTDLIALADFLRCESAKMNEMKRKILLEVNRDLEKLRLHIKKVSHKLLSYTSDTFCIM